MRSQQFERLPGRSFSAVIFDCDGVLVDSEPLANRVMSELLAENGLSVSPQECLRLFVGLTVEMEARLIRERFGVDLGDALHRELTPRTIAAFERELRPVPGIDGLLRTLNVPIAVASSSLPQRVRASLRATGIEPCFGEHINTVFEVARPKPAPDVYIRAAARLDVAPHTCLVFEDSVTGVRAAAAAGMTVIGHIGGGHRSEADRRPLLEAGATQVIAEWNEWH